MKSEAGIFLGKALDFLLPPLCFGCAREVEVQGGLCPACWSGLHFIARPYCNSCGFPFAHDMPNGVLCASCHEETPRFAAARSALAYNQGSRPLVLAFKHGGRTEGLKTMGKWLAKAADDFPKKADLIVPIPLHPMRLLRRKFNQSALLSEALSKEAEIPWDPFILKRQKNTKTQGGLNKTQRQSNVRAAFQVTPGSKDLVAGKTIILVDDVLTTGATMENAIKALQKAGADAIYALTLARVVEPLKKSKS